jgi:hypothetical protein
MIKKLLIEITCFAVCQVLVRDEAQTKDQGFDSMLIGQAYCTPQGVMVGNKCVMTSGKEKLKWSEKILLQYHIVYNKADILLCLD